MKDWRDALGNLKGTLPEGEDLPETPAEEKPEKGAKKKHKLHVELDRKRAGKIATIIWGFETEEEAREMATDLKKRLAVGGSQRGTEILLQGDVREKVEKLLR